MHLHGVSNALNDEYTHNYISGGHEKCSYAFGVLWAVTT